MYSEEASFLAPEEATQAPFNLGLSLKIFEKAQEPVLLAEVFHLFRI
jgi:hypothetical protein